MHKMLLHFCDHAFQEGYYCTLKMESSKYSYDAKKVCNNKI
jgi:hypothetical protein